MDHERAAADRGAVDPFGRDAEVVRDGHRRLAGGRDPVDVGGHLAHSSPKQGRVARLS